MKKQLNDSDIFESSFGGHRIKKMSEKDEKVCFKCGYLWIPRIKDPKCCPRCMSRKWNLSTAASAGVVS